MSWLTLALIALSIVAWSSVVLVKFHKELITWFDNRFGRDKPIPVKEESGEETVTAPPLPFRYTPPAEKTD